MITVTKITLTMITLTVITLTGITLPAITIIVITIIVIKSLTFIVVVVLRSKLILNENSMLASPYIPNESN